MFVNATNQKIFLRGLDRAIVLIPAKTVTLLKGAKVVIGKDDMPGSVPGVEFYRYDAKRRILKRA